MRHHYLIGYRNVAVAVNVHSVWLHQRLSEFRDDGGLGDAVPAAEQRADGGGGRRREGC